MPDNQKFTAVVFFHGIGQQSRYEELSRILEAFDDYGVRLDDQQLKTFEAGLETPNLEYIEHNIGYASVIHNNKEIRFYEVYWAPLTATGTTGFDVLRWFFGLIRTPIHVLISPWNTHRRLRISYLYALWEKKYSGESPFPYQRDLIKHYNAWCDDARNGLESSEFDGDFRDFVGYLDQQNHPSDDEKRTLIDRANHWQQFVRSTEWRNTFIFLTLIYILYILPILTIGRVIFLLNDNIASEGNVTITQLINFISPFAESPVTWGMIWSDPNVLAFYLLLVIAVPLTLFILWALRAYGGDVQLWATYHETSEKFHKREEILKLGLDTMKHVLHHEQCDSVVVVGHSLGSTIAYDTLLSIGRNNRATTKGDTKQATKLQPPSSETFLSSGVELGEAPKADSKQIPVGKIRYFVTFGSPIDKIHYFFESKQGMFRPYERIVDTLRGDIGMPPFVHTNNGNRAFRWINFYNQEDYISSALYTPNPRTFARNKQTVENVPIKSHEFPSPGRSHLGYFKHETVIGVLYRIIFQRDELESSRILNDVLDDARTFKHSRQYFRNAILFLSWSLLVIIVCDMLAYLTALAVVRMVAVYTCGIFCVLLIGSGIFSMWRGHLKSFKKQKS
ncbi:MAG: hypothetical protein AAF846_16275 [Chloroflexota bacterium]